MLGMWKLQPKRKRRTWSTESNGPNWNSGGMSLLAPLLNSEGFGGSKKNDYSIFKQIGKNGLKTDWRFSPVFPILKTWNKVAYEA